MSFGCKKQVCSIRDSFSDLKQQGIVVYGLTDSSQKNMKKFVENNHLPFTLLHATSPVMKAYGVAGGFFGAKRHTILIDNGIIVCVIEDVDLANHPQQILAGFKARV
jgi:peroxiredoxin Q/BCP